MNSRDVQFPEVSTDVRDGTTYTFRQFQPSDLDGYLALYERVHGIRHTPEWFEWRFLDTPYLDHVPVFVATADGDVVATRPFFAFRMAVEGTDQLALLTVDTMVHPDHRRRGLFSTLTERAIEYYTPREPSFVFNQPNARSRPGFLRLGWREVEPTVKSYRVQHPRSLVAERSIPGARTLGPAASALTAVSLRATDSLRRSPRSGYVVQSAPGVDAERLSSLYWTNRPDAVHAIRDVAYYRWRYGSPLWERTTYVARSGDTGSDDDGTGTGTVGALVRSRTNHDGVRVTQVADVVPMTGDAGWRAGVVALLERVVADHHDSDLVAIVPGVVPHRVLTAFGFLPDDRRPLSWFAGDVRLCIRSLGGTPPGADPSTASRWLLSYGERDTT